MGRILFDMDKLNKIYSLTIVHFVAHTLHAEKLGFFCCFWLRIELIVNRLKKLPHFRVSLLKYPLNVVNAESLSQDFLMHEWLD